MDAGAQKPTLYANFVETEIVLFFIYFCSSIVLSSWPQYLIRQLRNSFASNHDSWEFKAHHNWKKHIKSPETDPSTTPLTVASSKNKISEL